MRDSRMDRCLRFWHLCVVVLLSSSTARSGLVISMAERSVALNLSPNVRSIDIIKLQNQGPKNVSDVLLALPDAQTNNLAQIQTFIYAGMVTKMTLLRTEQIQPNGKAASNFTIFSAALPEEIEPRKSVTLLVDCVFAHSLKPFPGEITQNESQLVLYTDNVYYTSPYHVKYQELRFKLGKLRVESYTNCSKVQHDYIGLRYGPFEEQPAFSYSPVTIHYEFNIPFPVANELVREIEISHWGNLQVTEQYNLSNAGAHLKNGFSTLDYDARTHVLGPFLRTLVAILPPRSHSVYYRDELGNISTSHLWSDSEQTKLEFELRSPLYGGWKTTFTVGYSLSLQDFLFELADGRRVLNISFGCPIIAMLIEKYTVKVVLPEGSKNISVSTPFPTKNSKNVKYSHLDIVGWPVVVLEKDNFVQEVDDLYFQVFYRFNNILLLSKPMMLTVSIFLLFVACIVCMRTDLTISKTSCSHVRCEQVQLTVQHIRNKSDQFLKVHDKLEFSMLKLFRSGDIMSCKMALKTADVQLKEMVKEVKQLLTVLQTCNQASLILPKLEELAEKEKKMHKLLIAKHATEVKSIEKKLGVKERESGTASQQKKLALLRQEIESLLNSIDDIMEK